MEVNIEWKDKNKEYLGAIEKFLDKVSNVENDNLRREIIGSALKCDEILTKLAIEEIKKA